MNRLTMNGAALLLYSIFVSISCPVEANGLKTQNRILYDQVASVFSDLMKQDEITQITPLKGGVSGAGIYEVVAGDQTYVLRLLPKNEPLKPIKREFDVSIKMGELGVSPKVHAYSYEQRALVMSAVKGEPLWRSQLTPKEMDSLGEKMSIIHEVHLSDNRRPTTPEVLVNRIQLEINLPLPEAYQIAIEKHRAHFKLLENKFALTHTDLNPGNLLKSDEGIKIIDWTDAALTHPYLDLACVAVFYVHDPKQRELLLSSYTKGESQKINKRQLNAAYKIYNLILSLRMLNTAKRAGALKNPTSSDMKEARKIVRQKEWGKMISSLKDKDKAYAFSLVFLEQSTKDLF